MRAGAIVFGGWLVVDGLVLNYMPGNIHAYYCLAIAPAVAAMFANGVAEMWTSSGHRALGRVGLALMVLTAGLWSWWILGRNAGWIPQLRWTIAALTVTAAIGLVVSAASRRAITTMWLVAGMIAGLAGPAAYSIATLGQPHGAGRPSVGPAAAADSGETST